MNSITKKIGLIIIGLALAVAIPINSAKADTISDLQAQIAALLAQINSLTAQLSALQGGSSAGTGACTGITFSRNLSQGSSGTDVKCLQAILNQAADTQVAASGAGSPGSETTYFGALTKTAVVKFQQKYTSEILTPVGLSAGTGYVGASTRAKLNTMVGAVTPGQPQLPTAAGLTVSLASDNPIAASIISDSTNGAQALIPFLKLNFGTPSGSSANVTGFQLQRTGISSDSDIKNVYLYDGNTKLAEMSSLSTGIVTFTNSAGLFSVSGAKTITVKVDIATTTAGKTIGFQIPAASSITTNASAVNGTFPINGNLMTTATVSDLATLKVGTTTNAATIDPGTTGFEAMVLQLTASNQNVDIYSIKLLQLGSINATDISNISLWVGATQIGSTVANLASDRTVTFDLSSSPYRILSGVTKNISVKVDVIGGSTRTIQFSLQRSSDIVAKDSQYGVNIQPYSPGTASTWTSVWTVLSSAATTVNSGNLIISKRSDSPSGSVTLNGTNITLAKFDVKALGEDVKVSSLGFKIASSSGQWDDIKNGRLIYDGSQIGTTQTQVINDTTYTVTVNFTVPVGVTKVIEIRADMASYTTASGYQLGSGDGVQAYLTVGSSNAQRMTSLGTFGFPASEQAGNSVTVSSAALSASKNLSVGDITTVRNVSNVTIGSYLVTAGSAEGVILSKITISDALSNAVTSTDATYSLGAAFTNLKLFYGSTQIGTTVTPNTSDSAGTDYNFYPSPGLSLAAGQQIRVDLKADIIASTTNWTTGNATQLVSMDATGAVTSNSANFTAGVAGQALTLTTSGTLLGAKDASSPDTYIAAMGSTQQVMGVWKLSSGPLATPVEDLTVSQILVFNTSTNATSSANVQNMTLWCGSDQFGATAAGLTSATVNYAAFGGSCVIPKGSSKLITLKSDIPSFQSARAGYAPQFFIVVPASITGVSTDPIIARGAGDYAATTYTEADANAVYPYRASLSASIACYGSCTGRVRQSSDHVADLTLTATGDVSAQFRAALQGPDDSSTTLISRYLNTAESTNTVATSSVYSLDNSASILWTANASSSAGAGTTTWVAFDMGSSGIGTYSKINLWIYTTLATNTELYYGATDSWRFAWGSTTVSMTNDTWNLGSLNISSSSAAARYVGVALRTLASNVTFTYYIDAIKAYNDSISMTVSGNTTSTATGTPFYLKSSGGTQYAVGYNNPAAGTVVFVPDVDINTPQTLQVITNTSLLMNVDTTATETLNLSSSLGTYASVGDFRWYDQAVLPAYSPITWLNGASPISVSLGY